ncbi:MAG: hypothetical protein L3J23_06460 [Flavobacteriaceae bacterium]|nr:hypothetical protein [Flavobacteriaceae bacterium]
MSLENYIVTPLDSAVLDTKEQYSFYFKIVKHTFKELISSLLKNKICNEQETIFFKQYTELLIYSLEALRVKYLFNDEDKMKIDLTESGFPNYMEFRYLVNDLSLKHKFLEKLPKIKNLKTEFLETLFKHKETINKVKLHQAASIIYYTTINKRYIFKRFVQGKIIKTSAHNSQYLVSWSFYDITYNRPFICFMYFNYDGKNIEDYKSKIYDVLKITADRSIDLDTIAYLIDKKLEKIYPKQIKKLDLGPLHNLFAKDENIFTHTLLTHISNKSIDMSSYCISLHIDEVYSKDSFKEGSFFNKQKLQIWQSQKKQKFLFAPHSIMQLFYNKIPESINLLSKPPFVISSVDQ